MPDRSSDAAYHAPAEPPERTRRRPGWRAAVRRCAERRGYGERAAVQSVWFDGPDPAAHAALVARLRVALDGRRDVGIALTAPGADSVDRLRRRFPDDIVGATPVAAGVDRFLARVHPAVMVAVDGAAGGGAIARVRAAGVPVRLAPAGAADTPTVEELRALLPPPITHASTALPAFAPPWQAPTLRDRAGQSRLWRSVSPWLARRRHDDWASLRARLGEPQTVMCLGNGPSSEDPRLASIAHDCLIRVNWRWLERGFLARPDIVFVGDAATLHRAPPCIFGLWSIPLEHAMLLRHLVLRGPRAMEFVTLERLSPLAAVSRWPARPSNGALAILTAVGLAPRRIVIGGMDLFAHPAGRYPGAPDARNDYSTVHSRDVELDLIAHALASFDGEGEIVGDILRDALSHRPGGARLAA